MEKVTSSLNLGLDLSLDSGVVTAPDEGIPD